MKSIAQIVRAGAGLVVAGVIGVSAAEADHRPVIAVPGNAQVPVIIDGMDASYAVVIGEWGLHAPGRLAPKIIAPLPSAPFIDYGYYPATGRAPRYGRQELDVPGRVAPAVTFHRSWTSESPSVPVTEYPPYEPPEVTIERRGRRFEPRRRYRRD
jgi:hypothetical protein